MRGRKSRMSGEAGARESSRGPKSGPTPVDRLVDGILHDVNVLAVMQLTGWSRERVERVIR